MAEAVREKKGFYDSLYSSALSRDGASTETLPASIWQSFKLLFSGKFALIMKISLLNLIFCLPIIAWSIVSMYIAQPVGATVGYSQNIGIGYLFYNSAILDGNYLYFINAMFYYAILIACIVVACVGAGALFYTARRLLWNQDFKLFRDFFGGVKATWMTSLIGGVLSGGGFILMVMNLYIFDAYGLPVTGKVFGIIGSVIIFAFLCIYSVYLVSLNATYKMSLPEMLVGALKLTVSRLFPNLVMVVLCAAIGVLAWVIETFLNSFAIFAYALLFVFGIYFCVAVCTVNTHRQFDRFINGVSDKPAVAVVYAKKENAAEKEAVKPEQKKKPAQYVNPKKGKKKPEHTGADAVKPVKAIPDNVKAGENGLDEDLSVYVDNDDE